MRASLAGRVLSWSLVLVVVALGACGDGDSHHLPGPPTLVKFLVQVPGEADLDLVPPDGGAPPSTAVSGMASVRLVFNRLLDGDKIETVTPAGPMARTDVITATWVNAPTGAPPLVAATLYDPSGALAVNVPGPKILVGVTPGFPSGAQISFKLDRAKITSKQGEPFIGADVHTMTTLPFAASLSTKPGEAVPANATVQLVFTNVPAMNVIQRIKVTGGAVEVTPDGSDPRRFNLAPLGGWVPGQSYTITVDKEAADHLGVKLATDAVLTLSILPLTDAGQADLGAADAAGADAGAPDAAAADAGGSQD